MRSALRFALAPLIALSVGTAQPPPNPIGNAVKVRILDCNGGPVVSARVSFVRAFERDEAPFHGTMPECPDRVLSPRDFRPDSTVIEDLPAGRIALVVRAEPNAPAISVPFTARANEVLELTVRLTRGAVLEGVVNDESGKPVADAEVRTASPDDPCWWGTRFGGPMLPELITKTVARTDHAGRYRLRGIAHGTYRVVVAHPDYCEMRRDLEVAQEDTVPVPPFTLPRGTVVEGLAVLDGEPCAAIRVSLVASEPRTCGAEVDDRQQSSRACFMALTDTNGNYRFGERIPPGTWRIHASKPEDDHPFGALMQMKATERPFPIAPDMEKRTQCFQLRRAARR